MKKILTIHSHDIPLSAHLQFFYQTDTRLSAAGEALRDAIAALLPPFHAALTKENAVYLWIRKSELTKAIAKASDTLDGRIALVNAGVDFGSRSLTPATAESGARVYDMLKNYGKIMDKSYDAKAGAVREVIQHFNTDYAQDIVHLGLGMQVQSLEAALNAFVSLLNQRSDEKINKPNYTAAEARKELEGAWQPIVYIINSNAGAGTATDFATFIDHLNPEIERINAEFHRAHKDLGEGEHTVISPIPAQQYTGQPVTPVPEVYYTEDGKPAVKLFLGNDFSITYKDNQHVGMAELTIHGKGKYKGKKSATFHIARAPMPS
ncbi:MAG: DUF6261 family protein [Prevotellaceae bacterium]|jgi:hypothetical protein|nr:DUF6261 family protein [Prevotellaceae bacterium]